MAETAHGGPFREVLEHEILLNCILARPGAEVFVPAAAAAMPRRLTVIGDVACDPTSEFSPVKVYHRVTSWNAPALRVRDDPPLDPMAIDNLPSLLPLDSSRLRGAASVAPCHPRHPRRRGLGTGAARVRAARGDPDGPAVGAGLGAEA